jgi:hypothetical protein
LALPVVFAVSVMESPKATTVPVTRGAAVTSTPSTNIQHGVPE